MGVSADVEMVRPAFGDEGIYGVEGTGVPGQWDWRIGLASQYERAPVLILTEGEISSRPVTDRVGGWGGFSMGFGHGLAAQVVLPLDYQGGDDPTLSAPGGGLGDPRLGVRYAALNTQFFDVTARGDLFVPVGRKDAWLGEGTARGAVGASAALDGGFGALLVDAGLTLRPLESPQPGLDWGPARTRRSFGRGPPRPNTCSWRRGAVTWACTCPTRSRPTGTSPSRCRPR